MTRETIAEYYPDTLYADGFDDALLGVQDSTGIAVYSIAKCIEILMTEDEMSEEDALEHFSFNVSGGYVGGMTPIWVEDRF
jgi:hypothetical protein